VGEGGRVDDLSPGRRVHVSERRVVIEGRVLTEGALVDALRSKERTETRLIVEQLKEDLRVGARDSDALYVISRAFRPAVRGWLRQRWFRNDASTVDEVWNDTLLRIYSRINSYDPTKSEFATWILNQARYGALDTLRRQPKGRYVPFGPTSTEVVIEPLTQREREALRRAWRHLTRTERQLVHLRLVLNLSYAEIAADLGGELPEAHVRVYAARALKRLRQFYDQEMS
jgi:RNA polymerase sigma factor (sigma-70 family)